jgi:diguanylate cyclase (GGDEF)-like protein/PAS domain S-box-containing protein/putative nucleotidyltransferase with HDIG domain
MSRSNKLASLAAETGDLGIWQIHFDTRCYVQTARNRTLLGFSPDQVDTKIEDWVHLIRPGDRNAAIAALEACMAGDDTFECEYGVVPVAGRERRLLSRGFVSRDLLGRPSSLKGVTRDITDQGDEHAGPDGSENAIVGLDLDGVITGWNAGAERVFGWTADEAIGRSRIETVPHDRRDAYRELLAAVGRGEVREVAEEFRLTKDGRIIPVSIRILPVRNSPGQIVALSAIVHDRSREREADYDRLTGLRNHAAFQRSLDDAIVEANRSSRSFVLALLDVDNFRFFNDAYGYLAGDGLLRETASTLRRMIGFGDIISRYGDDEFAIVAFESGRAPIRDLPDRLRREFSTVYYEPPGYDKKIPISVSIGCAVYPDDWKSRSSLISAAEEQLSRDRAGSDAGAVEADRLRTELANSREGFGILNALVTAVDNKDRYTRRHSEDVMKYSVEVARELGLDDSEQRRVAVAALLHDVGKIGVPDFVLRKPGVLTPAEFETMRQHPQMGAIMVTSVPGFEETIDAVRHHHERSDGEGYPFGLRGEEIPLIARLMAVADAYSAMTTDRPYRKSLSPDSAKNLLRTGSGTQWDPACVEALLRAGV